MRTRFDSKFIMEIIAEMDTENAILAVDADDCNGPYLTPKFGPDRRNRTYITADTLDELRSEIAEFDRPTRSGTAPNTSLILTPDELAFIEERFDGSKSAAIHAALAELMRPTG